MLGEVPSGWQIRPLSDFLKESRVPGSDGRSASKLSVKLYGRGVVAKEERSVGSENTKYFVRRAGQLLYSRLDFLNGAFGLVPRHLDHRESTADLPAFDIDPHLDPFWLLSFLTQPSFYERQRGAAIGSRKACRIAPDEFLRMQVPLPPLPEQKKIAALLSSVDEAMQATQAVIDQTRRVKEGLLQDLLTRGIGLTRFKQTEIGEIPEGWDVRRVGTLCERVTDGTHQSVETTAVGPVPFLYVSCLSQGQLLWDKASYIDTRTYEAISKGREAREGAVLYTVVGSYGNAAVLPSDRAVAFQRHIAVMYPARDKLLPEFLCAVLNAPRTKARVDTLVVGNAQKTLTLAALKSLQIAVPSLAEQANIASTLSSFQTAINRSSVQLAQLQGVKSGLLTDLLTGKVRVTP